jgi:secreted protein with Ig-like and vWFA domain
MKLTPDSPEITAYALGALDPETHARVEAELELDPVLLAEVEAIRACAMQLTDELSREPASALDDGQRARIREASGAGLEERHERDDTGTQVSGWLGFFGGWWRGVMNPGWGLAMAGAAAVGLTLWLRPPAEPEAPAGSEAEIAGNDLRYQPGRSETVMEGPGRTATEVLGNGRAAGDPVEAARVATPSIAPSIAPSMASAPTSLPAPRAEAAPDRVPVRRRAMLDPVAPRPVQAPMVPVPTADLPMAAEPMAAESRMEGAGARMMDPVLMKRYGLMPRENLGLVPMASVVQPPVDENPFRSPLENPLSTFGLDVDTASHAIVRRYLNSGQLPPPDVVRLEEIVNYFPYGYREPTGSHPVGVEAEVATSPFRPGNRLVRIAVKTRELERAERPSANLVFLVDVSGSMASENRLPLVQRSLRLLVDRLREEDRVAIVTYAGEARVAMASAGGRDRGELFRAIDRLRAGGSTHGSAGIGLAYEQARAHFVTNGVNRVILCTDGDFNVGLTSREALEELIAGEARSGVFLTVMGYGMENYRDATAELLADRGNGNYAYIDSFREAGKVLGQQLESTLVTVAKDVKLQVEFNPARVLSWRLLGYENRALADRDFNDDTKDAGDLGAGHTVTALYEIVPVAGGESGVDLLRYGVAASAAAGRVGTGVHTNELMHIKLRYKAVDSGISQLLQQSVMDGARPLEQAGDDFRFSAAAAGFAMLLRNSAHRGDLTYERVLRLAESALGPDTGGYRAELVDLVRRAQQLSGGR